MSSVFTLEGPAMAGPRVTLLSPGLGALSKLLKSGCPRGTRYDSLTKTCSSPATILRGLGYPGIDLMGLGYPGIDLMGALGLSDTGKNIAYFAMAAAGGIALGYGAVWAKKKMRKSGGVGGLLGLGRSHRKPRRKRR